MKEKKIKSIVNQVLMKSGSSAKVEIEAYFPGDRFAGGKYHFGTHTITLYIEEIRAQCLQIFSSLDFFEDYLTIVFAHELGHAEDKELPELIEEIDASTNDYTRNTIALKIEKNAWEYARTLLPEQMHPLMETIIHHSLQPYHEAGA